VGRGGILGEVEDESEVDVEGEVEGEVMRQREGKERAG
jgi:hypothetical protein